MRSLNLAYNCITAMKDISMYRQLSELVLDGNKLTRIEGLEQMPYLKARPQYPPMPMMSFMSKEGSEGGR